MHKPKRKNYAGFAIHAARIYELKGRKVPVTLARPYWPGLGHVTNTKEKGRR
jgi:hypothetical protein